jgi:hypothetical protein
LSNLLKVSQVGGDRVKTEIHVSRSNPLPSTLDHIMQVWFKVMRPPFLPLPLMSGTLLSACNGFREGV